MKENSTGIVILSRYNSSRLPGKALKTIRGKEVLAYITDKLCSIIPSSQIIIATSKEESDNAIAEFAERKKLRCYRGSLDNVAERFFEASLQLKGNYACRINGDNIFLNLGILKELILQADSGKYSFLSNVKERTFPKGMSVEIASKEYFRKHLDTINSHPKYREHVMVYLYERAETDRHFYLYNSDYPEAAGIDLALDTPDDFERCRWMIEKMQIPFNEASMPEILKLYHQYELSLSR